MVRFAAISAACLAVAGPAIAAAPAALRPTQARPLEAMLRGVEPATTGSVEHAPAESARPPCPPERRVGTGAGFCLLN